jgi:hypothetical protein
MRPSSEPTAITDVVKKENCYSLTGTHSPVIYIATCILRNDKPQELNICFFNYKSRSLNQRHISKNVPGAPFSDAEAQIPTIVQEKGVIN